MKSSKLTINKDKQLLSQATCWILVDENSPELEAQCTALAEQLELKTFLYRLSPQRKWYHLPIWLSFNPLLTAIFSPRPLSSPWPQVIISSGVFATRVSASLRHKYDFYSISIEKPSASYKKFDLIISSSDTISRQDNFLYTVGALHQITEKKLKNARKSFYRKIEYLPHPRVGILFNEVSDKFLLNKKKIKDLSKFLHKFHKVKGGSFMITLGRPQPSKALHQISESLKDLPCYLWDGEGEDPYLGILSHSEFLITHNQSISLTTEATFTESDVYIYGTQQPSLKVRSFLKKMTRLGYIKEFKDIFEENDNRTLIHTSPLREVEDIKQQVYSQLEKYFLC